MPLAPAKSPDCPFCSIADAYPPVASAVPSSDLPSLLPVSAASSSSSKEPLAHLLLSTPHILAFLDHAPISTGHVLVATRQHRIKVSDVSIEEGSAIGAWIGILSRATVRAARGIDPEQILSEANKESDVGDWNIVQNNGARAAQVVPHVHFHIIPRVGNIPEVKARSWTMFGRGQREDLDEGEADFLTKQIRKGIEAELQILGEREGEEVMKALVGAEYNDKRTPKL